MANESLFASCARARTEQAAVRALVCCQVREVRSAMEALADDSPVFRALKGHERFAGLNQVCAASGRIAAVTRRYEVFRRIVESAAVKVIDNQCALARALADQPIHKLPAPVARVRSRTDLVPKDESVNGDSLPVVTRLERVISDAG